MRARTIALDVARPGDFGWRLRLRCWLNCRVSLRTGPAGRDATRPARPELPPPYVTRQSNVEIPFSVKAGDTPATEPAAVRVFVSWDRGKTWHFYDERKPEDGKFRFQPRQDGEFWFATQTVDRSGKTDSAEPRQPQLRLVIDTQKPQLLAQPSVARAGEVMLNWSVADASLAPSTLKIEYQDAAGSGPWQAVEVDPRGVQSSQGQMAGRVLFEPQIAGKAINLRAEIGDAAGNIAYFTQRVSLALPRSAAAGSPPAAPPPDRTATHWPTENPFTELATAPPGRAARTGRQDSTGRRQSARPAGSAGIVEQRADCHRAIAAAGAGIGDRGSRRIGNRVVRESGIGDREDDAPAETLPAPGVGGRESGVGIRESEVRESANRDCGSSSRCIRTRCRRLSRSRRRRERGRGSRPRGVSVSITTSRRSAPKDWPMSSCGAPATAATRGPSGAPIPTNKARWMSR